ncbi:cation:proton antiporter [Nanoarchaeota archaeon]
MADTALLYLTALGALLLIGLLCSIFSTKLRLSAVFFLVLSGIGLRFIKLDGQPLLQVPADLTLALGVLTLILVVFDASSKFKLHDIGIHFGGALKLTFIFLVFTLILFTMATNMITGASIFISLVFAAFMAGTSPDIAIAVLGGAKHKVIDFLEIESIINTPIIVLIPFIIIDLFENVGHVTASAVVPQLVPFAQQIITGVGTGVVVGLLMFKVMSHFYEEKLSPIAVVAAALLTYVLAEHIGGNGVLAVTTMAVIYGNLYIVHKQILGSFISIFSSFFQVLVFILIGLIIEIPLSWEFFGRSTLLFLAYMIVRWMALQVTFWNKYNWKEKLFMTINAPKGIATAVVIFLLSAFEIPGLDKVLDYGIIFIIYSILASTIVAKFSHFFIEVVAKSTVEIQTKKVKVMASQTTPGPTKILEKKKKRKKPKKPKKKR